MKEQVLTIEQCNKLLEMGIDMSDASMCWEEHDNLDRGYIYDLHIGYHSAMSASFIPTYTLNDILKKLPKLKDHYYPQLTQINNMLWQVSYNPKDDENNWVVLFGSSPIEACYNMLIYCHIVLKAI